MTENIIKFMLILVLVMHQASAQECKNILLATKAFPSADSKVIWSSNRPLEYLYPGEKIHVLVTGQLNYMPEKKSEDRGGVFGLFSERVEWVEDHWMKPKDKKPIFRNANFLNGNERLNNDGSYECDLTIALDETGLIKQTVLEPSVLNENELSGSGGLTTGEYLFQLTIDNSNRFQLVKSEISSKLGTWGANAVSNLNKLIEEDDRIKCKYYNELAETILAASKDLPSNSKQQILQYATSLSPQNHDITIALAQTYIGVPGGCEKQIEKLSNVGITQINVDPTDFKIINNSAKAFDILASAYYECNDDFRDPKSVDSLRNFYRIAATQYEMVFDYSKQIEMSVKYANAELDYNDKTEIQNAAAFLEETWHTIPRNFDYVGGEERQAFFTKFGNTNFVKYSSIQDSIAIKLEKKTIKKLISAGMLSEDVPLISKIEIVFKKQLDSSVLLVYDYIEDDLIFSKRRHLTASLDKYYKITSFTLNSLREPIDKTSPFDIEIINNSDSEKIKSDLPEVISSFIRLLDISTYCPKGTTTLNETTGNTRASHIITHSLGNFSLLYHTNEPIYSVKMLKSLPFILISDSLCFLSENRNTAEQSKNHLVLNMNATPIFVDGTGNTWKVTEVNFH